MWETVDLRELRVFLALAEELHFGRTAERLRLTPSRVSQALRVLERKLGVELVHRTSRRVELTAAGERFRREAGAAYGELMDVLQRTRAEDGMRGVLRLGVLTVLAAGPHLLEIVDAFTARHPECRVEVAQASLSDPFSQVRRGEVDVMASWLPLGQPDLAVGPVIWQEPRVLAVARDHPLAQRDAIAFEDLADAAVAAYAGLPDELHEAWVPSRTPSGRTIPRVGQPMAPNDVTTLAVRLALGEIVHPTVPSVSRFLGDLGIVYLPIAGMPPLRSALVWHRGRTDLRVREFADTARDVLKAAGVRFEPAEPAPVAA